MNINPMQLLKLKSQFDAFSKRHRNFIPFLKDAGARLDEGSVLEISLTTSTGQKVRGELKITAEDKELLGQLTGAINSAM